MDRRIWCCRKRRATMQAIMEQSIPPENITQRLRRRRNEKKRRFGRIDGGNATPHAGFEEGEKAFRWNDLTEIAPDWRWNRWGEWKKIDLQASKVREVANAVDPSGWELVERRHAGTVGVLVDGGEGGGGEMDPIRVVEKERMDVRSIDDAGNDTTLLVVRKEEHQAASSESVVTEV